MDVYELEKAQQVQDLDNEIVYTEKKFGYIQDSNGSSYSNQQISLVQFNMNNVVQSNYMVDPGSMMMLAPIVYTGSFSQEGVGQLTIGDKTQGYEFLITPKNNLHLVYSFDYITKGGATIAQLIPNISFPNALKMLSMMSRDDLITLGKTLGVYPDSALSYSYDNSDTCQFGNGCSNNRIFPMNKDGTIGNMNYDQMGNGNLGFASFSNCYNYALQQRSMRIANDLGNPVNGLNNIMNAGNYNTEFRPYFTYDTTSKYMIWYDYAIIKLGDIIDYFKQVGHVAGMDGLLRVNFNTGFTNVNYMISNPATTPSVIQYMNGNNTSFGEGCCPFTVNTLPASAITTLTGYTQPANNSNTTITLTASCTLYNNNITQAQGQGGSVVLSKSGAQSALNQVRIYYNMIRMRPEILEKYISKNRNKKVIYTNILSNNFNSIGAMSQFSQQIFSGLTRLKTLILMPFVSRSVNGACNINGTAITPFPPFASPFASEPNTCGCISLTRLNVKVGLVNVFMDDINYTFDEFTNQINLWNNINSCDYGISCGSIDQFMYENAYRAYVIDISRCSESDELKGRDINISFTNNTQVPIDLYVFVEQFRECVVDCATGAISMANP